MFVDVEKISYCFDGLTYIFSIIKLIFLLALPEIILFENSIRKLRLFNP